VANSEGKCEQAIEHYRHAWQHAAHLVVKLTVGPGNAYGFDFLGFPGNTYEIQASSDLVNWKSLGLVRAGADGVVSFTDPEAANNSRRFYRVLPK
jgi:hypothetical protein